MKSRLFLFLVALLSAITSMNAQVMSGATNTIATEVPHTTIPYRIEDKGTKLPDITWGLDLAWISEGNLARGVNYAGKEMIDIVRLSFQTTAPVTDGTLSKGQKDTLDLRIGYVKKWAPNAGINLNSDQEAGVIDWYHSSASNSVSVFPPRWAALIAASKDYVEAKGLKVVSVSPFNEPDYTAWRQGTMAEMKEICRIFREDPAYAESFKDVKLCGGNTLNCDPAWDWYNYSKDYLDEGNTHQLAGSFDNFAAFYQKVKADGKVGVGDELHNTMECMVGSEYGLTKGIWWGTCEHTRSQFMKASRGTRMGYAENRERWTAASVYRHADGYREGCDVQGFVGTSERQAGKTTFRFAALDHDVFYNGQGPAREFIIQTPGFSDGTGYDTEGKITRNAEAVFNIQSGDDIMPPLPTKTGTYRIVNRLSGFSLAPYNNTVEERLNLVQIKSAKNNQAQQWIITPDSVNVGGDFTNYLFASAKNKNLYPDVENWSLLDKGTIMLYPGARGDNEKWFFEYAGDGYFYIRSKHSALYLQTEPNKENGDPASETQMKVSGRTVNQGVFTGQAYQQWKLIEVTDGDFLPDAKAPAAPTGLIAIPQPASVRLEWTSPADKDVEHYIVLRSADQTHWNTIHHQVLGTAYIDNTVDGTTSYYYKVQAVDKSQNRSVASETVNGAATGEASCIMQISCDSLTDTSLNGNHAALYGTLTQQSGKIGNSITLVPKNENSLQLPATIANSAELTVSLWIYYRGGSNRWQRIFDFGSDTDHYVFLTPSNGENGKMRLALKNGGTEQKLETTAPSTKKWTHVAVTFAADKITLYVNGKAVTSSTSIKTRPADFRPVFNYIGRSQFAADPFLNADIDDARIYNYSLTADEIAAIANLTDAVETVKPDTRPSESRIYDLSGRQILQKRLPRGLYVIGGKTVRVQ